MRITDCALVAAATLSNRYITDRFLPDKAIDLMDEAASRLRMEVESKPEEIDELDRRIIQLKIEREALQKENDDASQGPAGELRRSSPSSSSNRRADQPLAGREGQDQAEPSSRKSSTQARLELEQAQRAGDLATAGELRYGTIPELEKQLEEAARTDRGAMLREEVTDEDIAAVVSRWTGIPVDKMLEGEREKLLAMEELLGKRVIGQDEAVEPCRTRCAARAPGCRTRTGRSAASCSSGPPASARPS